MKKYEEIIQRIKDADAGFHANDNITKFIKDGEKEQLIDELTEKFEGVLDALLLIVTMILTRKILLGALRKCTTKKL